MKINLLQAVGERKKLFISVAGVCMILALLLVLGIFQKQPSGNAAAVIRQAREKASAANYAAEYDEQFSRIIGGVSESYTYRVMEIKSGTDYKKEVYANKIALLEKFIRNNDGSFYCAGTPELACVRYDGKGALPEFDFWEKQEILKTSVSSQTVIIDESDRLVHCVQYVLFPEALNDENMAILFGVPENGPSSTVGVAAAVRENVRKYDVKACFDDSTGVLVDRTIKISQMLPTETSATIEYESEDRYVLRRLRLDPLVTPADFQTEK